MRNAILFFVIFLFQPLEINAQSQLNEYIDYAIKNNTDLQQASLQFESSLQSLKEAEGQMLPTVDLGSRYSRAFGGRAVEFPIGDLMNPVYNSLNSLTGEDRFSEVDNLSFNFNRTTDIDTKVTLTQPLLDKRLVYQKKIAQEQAKMAGVDINIAKRRLVANVKTAYYNYLKAEQLLELFQTTKELALENQRVSESLYRNDKVTADATYRSKTEVGNVELKISEAERMKNSSRAYFNFLLNRPLESEITAAPISDLFSLPSQAIPDIQKREEFLKIKMGMEANDYQRKLFNSNNLPNIYAVADYGFQGTEYAFNADSDYGLASLVLSWNLFSGFQNKARKQKSILEKQILQSQEQSLTNNIELESIQAFYTIKEKNQNYNATQKMQDESQFTYDLVNKKYKEGMVSQVELIDARTSYTNASIQNIISKYDIWISLAEYERVTASYPIKSL